MIRARWRQLPSVDPAQIVPAFKNVVEVSRSMTPARAWDGADRFSGPATAAPIFGLDDCLDPMAPAQSASVAAPTRDDNPPEGDSWESEPVGGYSDADLEAEYLGGDDSVDYGNPFLDDPQSSKRPLPAQSLSLSAEEREALAQAILPEDVLQYFQVELRGSFIDVRPLDHQRVY